MKKTLTLAMTAVMGVLALAPSVAMAADNACISQKRIYSTQPVDNRTVVFTDWSKNKYTVHLRGVCGGLWKGTSALGLRVHSGELGCIGKGDSISYPIAPGAHRVTCYVESVTAGAPADAGS